jgi:hypothetical protein
MAVTESQKKYIQQLEGPDAVLIPKEHFAAMRERTIALRKLLKKDGYCAHFKTSEEIISGVGKYLSQISNTDNGYEIADDKFRKGLKTDNMFEPGLLYSLSLLIAAVINKEKPLETYYFCEYKYGKYWVILRYFKTKVHIETELEQYLKASTGFPDNFYKLLPHLRGWNALF